MTGRIAVEQPYPAAGDRGAGLVRDLHGSQGEAASCCMGVPTTSRRPVTCERGKSVWLPAPTANRPRDCTATDAPTPATLSVTVVQST